MNNLNNIYKTYRFFFLLITILLCSCSNLIFSVKSNNYKDVVGKEAKHGIWIENLDSTAILISKYVRGNKEGKAKIIFHNGDYEILHFKNNLRHGLLKHYGKDGYLSHKIKYKKGKEVYTVIHRPVFF